jgi:hypothetical protein
MAKKEFERKLSDMNDVEKAQHRNWTEILKNPLSTPQERERAQHKIDALEWKGFTGPLMEMITKLTVRLDNIEEMGQSMTEADRKAIIELRGIAKRLDKTKLESLESSVGKCLSDLAELATIENQHNDDNQGGWAKHEAILVEARVKRQALSKKLDDVEQRTNEKFREVEKKVDDLRRDLNTLIADAIDEVKTSIMAESEAAAITAVGNLLGESDLKS